MDVGSTGTRWEQVQAAAIAHFADDEASLLDYAADLQCDRDVYRALSIELMGALHDLTMTVARLRGTVRQQHQIISAYLETPSTAPARRAA